MWPTVRRAIDWVLGMQAPGGEVTWERDAHGATADYALLTGCSQHSPGPAVRRRARRLRRRTAAGLGTGRRPARARDRLPPGVVRGQEPLLDGLVLPGAGRGGPRRGRGRAARRGLGDLRGARPGGPLRQRPSVGHRSGELRAGPGPGRGGPARDRGRGCSPTSSTCATTTAPTGPAGSSPTGQHYPAERSAWTAAAVILAADALSGATGGAGRLQGPCAGGEQPGPPIRPAAAARSSDQIAQRMSHRCTQPRHVTSGWSGGGTPAAGTAGGAGWAGGPG